MNCKESRFFPAKHPLYKFLCTLFLLNFFSVSTFSTHPLGSPLFNFFFFFFLHLSAYLHSVWFLYYDWKEILVFPSEYSVFPQLMLLFASVGKHGGIQMILNCKWDQRANFFIRWELEISGKRIFRHYFSSTLRNPCHPNGAHICVCLYIS